MNLQDFERGNQTKDGFVISELGQMKYRRWVVRNNGSNKLKIDIKIENKKLSGWIDQKVGVVNGFSKIS